MEYPRCKNNQGSCWSPWLQKGIDPTLFFSFYTPFSGERLLHLTHVPVLQAFFREGASLDMLSTYADKATLDRYCFLLPLFTATYNLNYVRLCYRNIAMVALAFEKAVERTGDIEERTPPSMSNNIHQRSTLFCFQL